MTASLPRLIRVRQRFITPCVSDVAAEVERQLQRLNLEQQLRPGQRVAITAGSRGIANIAIVLRAIVDHFWQRGAVPKVIPAMGSHGGATPAGQTAVLASLGVTEATMGCEIRAAMETVVVTHTPNGLPVHIAREAAEADHVFICNRVKPHTGFVGPVESGLHKMLLIGLGKHAGALLYHQAIASTSWEEIVCAVADEVLKKCRVLGGLAIVENARDETGLIAAVRPDEFWSRETALLEQAKAWLPRLPFPQCDLLIVDRIGKNISGTGMDTNVVGRKFHDHRATERDLSACTRIFVRGLTAETKGQAAGIGLAEFTNVRTANAIDRAATYVNCITSSHPTAGMLPLVYETDCEAITEALKTIGTCAPEAARVIQIRDTLHLEHVLVSEAYCDEILGRDDLSMVDEAQPMQFDHEGRLADVGISL